MLTILTVLMQIILVNSDRKVSKSRDLSPHSLMTVNNYFSPNFRNRHEDRCEPITVAFCMLPNYNKTLMPNMLSHDTQEEASFALNQLSSVSMAKLNCSEDLQLFICLVYIPVCTVLNRIIPPCRSLCLSVKNGCSDHLKQFDLDWPSELNCELFPDNNLSTSDSCFGRNETNSDNAQVYEKKRKYDPSVLQNNKKQVKVRDFGFVCPLQFTVPKIYDYKLKVGNKDVPNCGAPCNNMFFKEYDRQFARMWIVTWAFVCFLSCLFTVLTFLIDTKRFQYPERPIIFLSICYLMISFIYIFGYYSGDEIACRGPFNHSFADNTASVISQGTRHETCTIVFMVLYFFGMSSSIWWVILTLTWFLAAGLKWGHEAIEANSHYFHLAAWAIPSIKTVVILSLGKVEGDVLSGVCYVGIWNVEALRTFVLIPLVIYLLLGTVFLCAGLTSLFRIRTVMKHGGTKTDKLEKLMLRILIFSSLYTVPAFVTIACLFYEHIYFDSWILTWHSEICKNTTYSIPCPVEGSNRPKVGFRPIFEVFMLKYLMYMIVGITSTVWIWSGKTLNSWKGFYNTYFKRKLEDYV